MKDVVIFYSGRSPPVSNSPSMGKKCLANCIRCHEQTQMLINHERKCWNATGGSYIPKRRDANDLNPKGDPT
jgi:hypothetical protein